MSDWAKTLNEWLSDPPAYFLTQADGFVWGEHPEVHSMLQRHAEELLPYFSDEETLSALLPHVPAQAFFCPSKKTSPFVAKMFELDNAPLFKYLLDRKAITWGGETPLLALMIQEHDAKSCFDVLVRRQNQLKLFTPQNTDALMLQIMGSPVATEMCQSIFKAQKTSLKKCSPKIDQFVLSLKWIHSSPMQDKRLIPFINNIYFNTPKGGLYKNKMLFDALAFWASKPYTSDMYKSPKREVWKQVWLNPAFSKSDFMKHYHQTHPFVPISPVVQDWFEVEDFSEVYVKNKKKWPDYLEKYASHPVLEKIHLMHTITPSSPHQVKRKM